MNVQKENTKISILQRGISHSVFIKNVQLNPAIMVVKEPTNLIYYKQISVIANREIKRK